MERPRPTYDQLSFLAPADVTFLQQLRDMVTEAERLYGPTRQAPEHDGPSFDSPRVAYDYFRPLMADLQQEQLRVANLSVRHTLLSAPMVYQGTVSGTAVRTAEVFRPAIVTGAPAILVAHNHPSGDPSPSADDVRLTKKLGEAGRILDIEFLDHIIVTPRGYVSLREQGIWTP
jgi:DNA repair protein RadC